MFALLLTPVKVDMRPNYDFEHRHGLRRKVTAHRGWMEEEEQDKGSGIFSAE